MVLSRESHLFQVYETLRSEPQHGLNMAAIDLGIADLGNIMWFEKCWDFAHAISRQVWVSRFEQHWLQSYRVTLFVLFRTEVCF